MASSPDSADKEAHLVALHAAGDHTISEHAELFWVTRSTVRHDLSTSPAT